MKHKLSITLLLLSMFIVTQIIGIVILNAYAPVTTLVLDPNNNQQQEITQKQTLPYGLETTEQGGAGENFLSIIFALIFSFLIFGLLMKYNLKYVIKIWFILVIILALGITIYPIFSNYTKYPGLVALVVALPLAYYKTIKPNLYVHNLTELLIYPGIASVIVSLIYVQTTNKINFLGIIPLTINKYSSIWFVLFLLVLISIYDAWAVWKSGIMQKMAKYQMEELQIFGGFLFPTISKKEKSRIEKIRQKYKNKKMPKKVKKQKFKVSLAILGGGDVIFPIITAGVFMWVYSEQSLLGVAGLIPALFIIAGATLGLSYLFLKTEKGKAYPAMPYISAGIFIGVLLWKIFFY